eukprot:15462760-Alexandrium_andersonii.AAC.1
MVPGIRRASASGARSLGQCGRLNIPLPRAMVWHRACKRREWCSWGHLRVYSGRGRLTPRSAWMRGAYAAA